MKTKVTLLVHLFSVCSLSSRSMDALCVFLFSACMCVHDCMLHKGVKAQCGLCVDAPAVLRCVGWLP